MTVRVIFLRMKLMSNRDDQEQARLEGPQTAPVVDSPTSEKEAQVDAEHASSEPKTADQARTNVLNAGRSTRILCRSESDRVISGVAGGIAHRYELEPIMVRLGIVLATLFLTVQSDLGGLITFIYFCLWVLLPTSSKRPLVQRLSEPEAQRELMIAVIMAILINPLLRINPFEHSPLARLMNVYRPVAIFSTLLESALPVLLMFVAVLLLRRPSGARSQLETGEDTDLGGDDPPASTLPADNWAKNWHSGQHDVDGQATTRKGRREPSLWFPCLGLMVLFLLALTILTVAFGLSIAPGVWVNGLVAIVGLAVLASGFRGRAYLTLLLLVPLAPFWLLFSAHDIPLYRHQQFVRQGVTHYEESVGDSFTHTLEQPKDGARAEYFVGALAGSVELRVPIGANLDIKARFGAGVLTIYDGVNGAGLEPLVINSTTEHHFSARGNDCNEGYISPTGDDFETIIQLNSIGLDMPTGASIAQVEEAATKAGYEVIPDDPEALSPGQTGWSFLTNPSSNVLCRKTEPPTNPATIVIESDIGVGELRISRY